VAQVVECLPSQHEVLSSNTSTIKKKSQLEMARKGKVLAEVVGLPSSLLTGRDIHLPVKQVGLNMP
jgi:hypothetical protein